MVNEMTVINVGGTPINAYWNIEKIVAEVERSPLSKYVVSDCVKGDKRVVNLREWYRTSSDPTWKPSKNGLTLPHGDVARQVINAMLEANA